MLKGRKIVTFLIAMLAATLLWLYVITTVAPEANTRISNIPVTIDGSIILEERGLIVTDLKTSNISLEVSSSRLILTKLNAGNMRISADATKIREPGTYDLSYTVYFPDNVNPNDVDILRKSSNRVTVTIEKLEKRTLPITPNWLNAVADEFTAETGSAVLEPAEVTLTGPADELDRISKVQIDFDLASRNETVIERIPLSFLNAEGERVALSENTEANADETVLTLQILKKKTLTIKADLVEDNVVGLNNALVSYSPKTINVKGAADVIDALGDELIVGTEIQLSNIKEDKEVFRFNLELPAGVNPTNEGSESEVTVTVQIVGISKVTVPVSDIRVLNPMNPEEYETTVPGSVNVTVRGNTAEVRKIRQSGGQGLHVEVDLEGRTQTGSFTAIGQVVNDSHPNVSVVDQVEVDVSVTRIPINSETEANQ